MMPMAPWPALLYRLYVEAVANTIQLPSDDALDLRPWGLDVYNVDTTTLPLT